MKFTQPCQMMLMMYLVLQHYFKCGSNMEDIEVEFQIGHRCRRLGIPLLDGKFERNIKTRLSIKQADAIMKIFSDSSQLCNTSTNAFVDFWVTRQ